MTATLGPLPRCCRRSMASVFSRQRRAGLVLRARGGRRRLMRRGKSENMGGPLLLRHARDEPGFVRCHFPPEKFRGTRTKSADAERPRAARRGPVSTTTRAECAIPAAGMVKAVHFDGSRPSARSGIVVSRIEIYKIVADDLGFVAHAQHEAAKVEDVRMFHDVQKDWIRADRRYWPRAKFARLLGPGTEAAIRHEDMNFWDVQRYPCGGAPTPRRRY